ncbi:uncharacterized protein BJ171DRAFT_584950 [Polychytrium aggregatum]|uniref:uncharacterized protein n=1 Tax=Polychytrium aggregatum TaxID=110093 RepID=UPI0022FDC7A8|nr:uncharacterized protein BJ171DRAFT_617271 [Polychytrium aggregatum]XP_052963637.1 uncharacterized protein BJ171DRAFT_584945 [Polychytrium aggregatum]XP_052963641.1 uncharacterized protein BJ171DRAFT_584950 [Polychytrium aggregatum]KAI9190571.1 hypothetical protein BJ171DRAFT_617271 [Polychytrium aggregatum]KAI9199654.1 hypothetical protein BJ171DRAFT_584945 [Polychytrium aggregatum]KAI9199658.1 hypothetical protein BJ171DRAFT_584950 [Polychytrium aggregatum]
MPNVTHPSCAPVIPTDEHTDTDTQTHRRSIHRPCVLRNGTYEAEASADVIRTYSRRRNLYSAYGIAPPALSRIYPQRHFSSPATSLGSRHCLAINFGTVLSIPSASDVHIVAYSTSVDPALKTIQTTAMDPVVMQNASIFSIVVYIGTANLAFHCTKYVKWRHAFNIQRGLQIHSLMALATIFSALYCIGNQLMLYDVCTANTYCTQFANFLYAFGDCIGSASIGWAYLLRLRVMTVNSEPMYAWLFVFGIAPIVYGTNDVCFILSTYGVISTAESWYLNFIFNLALEINLICLHVLMMFRLRSLVNSARVLRSSAPSRTLTSQSRSSTTGRFESRDEVKREGATLIVAIATELALYVGFQVYTQYDATGLIGNAVCIFLWVLDIFLFCVVNQYITKIIKRSSATTMSEGSASVNPSKSFQPDSPSSRPIISTARSSSVARPLTAQSPDNEV